MSFLYTEFTEQISFKIIDIKVNHYTEICWLIHGTEHGKGITRNISCVIAQIAGENQI